MVTNCLDKFQIFERQLQTNLYTDNRAAKIMDDHVKEHLVVCQLHF